MKLEATRLRQKLESFELANVDLRREIKRLSKKTGMIDKFQWKYNKSKIAYGKILSLLESSETIRRK
jgi:hypothetical protein